MDEKSIDPLELKKKILMPYLEFVKEMLVVVKGKSIEEKWKIMYECITSDKKRPSYEKIKQMEKTLIALKNQSKQKSCAPSSNSKPVTNPMPSTSKGINDKITTKEAKTVETNIERDPRKRISLEQNSSTVYKAGQKLINERLPTPPGHRNEMPVMFPKNTEKFDRNPRTFPKHQRGMPFNRRSFDNNPRLRPNQRHSPVIFNNKPQFRNERNQSLGRDDSQFKRKRSQSPANPTTRRMPKRRFSCYEPADNVQRINSERFKRPKSIEKNESTINNRSVASESKEVERTTSKTNTKAFSKSDDKNVSSKKSDNPQSSAVESKKNVDKKEIDSSMPTNVMEAIKKIQAIKIPKVGANKNIKNSSESNLSIKSAEIKNKGDNASKTSTEKIHNDELVVDKKLESKNEEMIKTKIDSSGSRSVRNATNKAQDESSKIDRIVDETESKGAKIVESNMDTKLPGIGEGIDKNESTITACIEVEEKNEKYCGSESAGTDEQEINKSVKVTDKKIVFSTEIKEKEGCEPQTSYSKNEENSKSEKVVNNSEPMEATNTEIRENYSTECEPKSLDAKDKKSSTEVQDKNELMDTSSFEVERENKNGCQLITPDSKDQVNSESEQVVDKSEPRDEKLNEVEEKKINVESKPTSDEQNDPTSSNASKKVEKIQKTSVLTNLLENEEEDPEKVLEGLISILGSEKVKKMQELLLKNTLKTSEPSESQEKPETAEKVEFNDEKHKVLLDSSSTEIKAETGLNATQINEEKIEEDDKNIKNVANEQNPSQSHSTKSENPIESPSKINLSPAKNNISPTLGGGKKRKKPRKKLSELDRLHENILSSIDCEGIMRACIQPRISTKPKSYDNSIPAPKNLETKPFTLKILRLNITAEDTPVILDDEFYKKYLTIQETKSRTVPRKRRTISHEKPNIKIPKQEPEFKTEPVPLIPVKQVPVEELTTNVNIMQHEKISIPSDTNITPKKKKRKILAWSKGILKKKPKRFKLGSIYDWEDVDSSDENTNYDRSMNLEKFKNLLDAFGLKCGYKKIVKRSNAHKTDAGKLKNNVENSAQENSNIPNLSESTDKSEIFAYPVLIEDNSKATIPKRINLPLEKNLLTMISKCNNISEVKSTSSSSESSNLSIKIKLPPVGKSLSSSIPTSQQTEQSNVSITGPTNELNTNVYSSQVNQQKVVIVKPLSKEINVESVKVRSLSAQEQQALKNALSSNKNQSPAPSTAQQSNEIIKNMLNLNTSLNITKISSQKSESAPTSKDDPAKKSFPKILNVQSISPKGSTTKPNPSKDEHRTVNIVSNLLTTKSPASIESKNNPRNIATTTNNEIFKIQEIVSTNPNATKTRAVENCKDGATAKVPESTAPNESMEIVDLIDDDDDDDVIDIMRPWIEKSEFKSTKVQNEAIKMVNNVHCLASLYKCMGSTCGYYTNDKELFQYHLELHREHQRADSLNYLLCCYCSFRSKSINLLLLHIENAHVYGKFGCRYCFYRSVNEYQVTANHHLNFHRTKEKCVILFESRKTKNENIDKSYISDTIPKVCPPLPCPYCRIGIFTTAEFETHVQSHNEKFTTVCIKCNQTTNKSNIAQHLLKCFSKFGNYQCVFCVFGTNNFSIIDSHLSSEHPDKLSYFAERILNTGKDPTSVESLTTKELSKRITGNVKKIHLKYSFNDDTYRNSENAGRLGEDFIIDQSRTIEPSTSDNQSFLQIGEVVSLHD